MRERERESTSFTKNNCHLLQPSLARGSGIELPAPAGFHTAPWLLLLPLRSISQALNGQTAPRWNSCSCMDPACFCVGQRAPVCKALQPAAPWWLWGSGGNAASCCCLMASSSVWARWPEGFYSAGWVIPQRKKCFQRVRERTRNCCVFFLKPVRSTSYAGWFSHCVFFLSFGTNTTSLYQKEGCSCLQTWGRGRLPSAVFVVFICHFHSLVS